MLASSPDLDVYSLQKGEVLKLKSKKYRKEATVEYSKEIHGASVIKFQHIDRINDAFKLISYSVYSEAEAEESEQSVIQFSVKDVQGNVWGIVKDIGSSGVSQVLEVLDPEGDVVYVPFSEPIIKEIDSDQKIILIDPPDGLRDLNKNQKK